MIEVASLTRNYGDFVAVDNVSFAIGPGEIVGLLGHNGAGKTTIMKMLTGFLEPTAGRITIDGEALANRLRQAQSLVGYLPENCPVYPDMSVVDYLDYAATLHDLPDADRGARIREAIARTELQERALDRIGDLSRGLRQRVGVAQAILHEPKVLILDEPTNGLDPTQIQHMRELIRSLSERSTVILSTHILQEVQAVCDRVIILRSGEKVLDARLEDLRTGKRLLVGLDAAPDNARAILEPLEPVESLVLHGRENGEYRYALTLSAEGLLPDASTQVARAAIDGGCRLYTIMPERRDLESIFGEISAPREVQS
ncbi:MAG: ABC transporter ATP-binding protein [Gammaproteobacteria bacterium]|jgi:ABC-2 type transport system ATP-binding protein|nr:ABC transporter ATP-binding protein [Gammaproteobacteria bacterium]